MTDARPLLLLSDPVLGPIAPMLTGAYRVERMWEAPDYDRAQVRAIVHAGDAVLNHALIESLPNLGLIACVSVGYDGIDVGHARGREIEVTHAPWLNADDTADYAIGLVIAAWRGIVSGDRTVRSGDWERGNNPRYRSLTGRRLGVVGLGRIGEGIARRAEAFGMVPAWWGPRDKPLAPWPRAASLTALAENSDIFVIAARSDESNRGLIDAGVIAAVGAEGLLVNVSRGWVVDEDALIAALKSGDLGLAALDVFATEPTPAGRWADVPNVLLSPHAGGAAIDTVMKMIAHAMENLRRHFAGEPLLSPVPG